MTTERPILLKDEMVRAILDGRKTQTRRVMKPQPEGGLDFTPFAPFGVVNGKGNPLICRHGQPSDRLWVRETWCDVNLQGAPGIAYRADEDIRDLMAEPSFHDEDGAFNYGDERVKPYHFAVWSEDLFSGAEGRWRPSIHMPRWASRITLEITDVRVERLQDISNEDAVAEGIGTPCDMRYAALDAFKPLWESINGHDSWEANPWVWVIEFKRIPQEATQ